VRFLLGTASDRLRTGFERFRAKPVWSVAARGVVHQWEVLALPGFPARWHVVDSLDSGGLGNGEPVSRGLPSDDCRGRVGPIASPEEETLNSTESRCRPNSPPLAVLAKWISTQSPWFGSDHQRLDGVVAQAD